MTARTTYAKPLLPADTAKILLIGLVLVASLPAIATALPQSIDQHKFFVPATRALWRGESPYAPQYGFFNPPWTLLLLSPFAINPALGRAAQFLLALITLMAVTRRMGAGVTATCLILVSPPMMNLLLDGNNDWLALGGLLLPPRYGLFLVTIKPQVGLGIGVWWVVEAWREDRWFGIWDLLGPIGLAYLLSFLAYGLWPLRMGDPVLKLWNTSLWPLSILPGLGLLAYGVLKRKLHPALMCSPLLSPHVILHSWITTLVGLVKWPWLLAAIDGLFWFFILKAL